MEPGIYDNLTNAEYHGGAGISKSGLDLIAKSPAHYYHAVNAANDNERVPTSAQAFGTAFHSMLLEPEEFQKLYTVELCREDWPDAIEDKSVLIEMVAELNKTRLPKLSVTGGKSELINRICDADSKYTPADFSVSKTDELKYIIDDINKSRTGLHPTSVSTAELSKTLRDNGKTFQLWSEVKANFAADNEGRIILSKSDFDKLISMRDAVLQHPAASYLMSLEGKAEQSVYWIDKETGVLCRCRPDWWAERRIIVDLKTCIDASPEGFAKSIYNWNYHTQDVMYRAGCEAVTGEPQQFVFLAVEKDACVVNGVSKGVAVYVLDDESRNAGLKQFRLAINEYAKCLESKVWPGYINEVQTISIPAWGIRKAEEMA